MSDSGTYGRDDFGQGGVTDTVGYHFATLFETPGYRHPRAHRRQYECNGPSDDMPEFVVDLLSGEPRREVAAGAPRQDGPGMGYTYAPTGIPTSGGPRQQRGLPTARRD